MASSSAAPEGAGRRAASAALVPREHLAHRFTQLVLRHPDLGRTALAPFLIGGDRRRLAGALDQVLDLHLAARLLVAALDDDAGGTALVGIFELRPHAARAEIELGADAGGAQGAH